MNTYLVIQHVMGKSSEVEADFYQREGEEWVFIAEGVEVLRVEAAKVAGIAKFK